MKHEAIKVGAGIASGILLYFILHKTCKTKTTDSSIASGSDLVGGAGGGDALGFQPSSTTTIPDGNYVPAVDIPINTTNTNTNTPPPTSSTVLNQPGQTNPPLLAAINPTLNCPSGTYPSGGVCKNLVSGQVSNPVQRPPIIQPSGYVTFKSSTINSPNITMPADQAQNLSNAIANMAGRATTRLYSGNVGRPGATANIKQVPTSNPNTDYLTRILNPVMFSDGIEDLGDDEIRNFMIGFSKRN